MSERQALLIVDVQNDFCPGGALAVPGGDEVVAILNAYIEHWARQRAPILASRDWHPRETTHFQEFGGPWPPHCIQNTQGAAFHCQLQLPDGAVIISKGTERKDESYSAFLGKDRQGKSLKQVLIQHGVRRLFVGGLATDYCVKSSVLGAVQEGFEAVLLLDAIRGIEASPGDVARALDQMIRAGARTATLETLELEWAREATDGSRLPEKNRD